MPKTAVTLQPELKQSRPFRNPAQESLLSLFRTGSVLRARLAPPILCRGVSLEQYNVLRILRGSEPHGLPTLDIAARLIDPAPAITRLVDKLESKKLVRRERSAQDRRQVWCRITATGLHLLAGLDGPVGEAEDAAMANLSAAEQRRLTALLAKLRDTAKPAPGL